MSYYITDFSSQVHDNIIQSYLVDFTNNTLKINTSWEDKENTVIEFTGLLAHKFENVILTNIIFGMYQMTIKSFIEEEKENLLKSLDFGYPSMNSRNYSELIKELENEKYKIFYIDSTLGLNGYVIAKDINFITKTR